MKKLAIFNLSKTLIVTKSGSDFAENPRAQMIAPGLASKITKLRALGYTDFAVATNQGGLEALDPETEKPYKRFPDLITELTYAHNLLNYVADLKLGAIAFCPDLDGSTLSIFRWIESQFVYDCNVVYDSDDPDVVGHPQLIHGAFRNKMRKGKGSGGMLIMLQYLTVPGHIFKPEHTLMIGRLDADRQAAEAAGIAYWDYDFWMSVEAESGDEEE